MSHFPQASTLKLSTKVGLNGKSIIDKMLFTPPFKVISPLFHKHYSEIMLLCVSAGLLKGDRQDINLHIGAKSQILLSTQSYEKIHDTQNGAAKREMHITLEENALLEYAPLPCIPFANACFSSCTNIHLHEHSKLYYSEILCAGRVERGEIFAFREFHSKLFISLKGRLIFFENTHLNPQTMPLRSLCAFGEYTHSLSYVIFDKNLDKKALETKVLSSPINAGISFCDDVVVIKALAKQAQALIELRDSLSALKTSPKL